MENKRLMLWLGVLVCVGFVLYIALNGLYISEQFHPVSTGVTLVDDDKFTVSDPIMVMNNTGTFPTVISNYPSVWDDYIVWMDSNFTHTWISFRQLSTWQNGTILRNYSDAYTVPQIYEETVVFNNKTGGNVDAIFVHDMSTNSTILIDNTTWGYWYSYPKIYGDLIAFSSWNTGTRRNVTYCNLDGTGLTNVPISDDVRPYFWDIYDDIIVYEGDEFVTHYNNMTVYDISENQTTDIFSSIGGVAYNNEATIWGDHVVWRCGYYQNHSIMFHDLHDNETMRVDWFVDETGKDNTSVTPTVSGDLVAWAEFGEYWRVLVWDSQTNLTFSVRDEFSFLPHFSPDMYYDGEDYILVWNEVHTVESEVYFDVMMVYINSTADSIPQEFGSISVYDYNFLYASIIAGIFAMALVVYDKKIYSEVR